MDTTENASTIKINNIIKTYLRGWEFGNAELSLSATADGFYYDDPNTGRIQRHEFIGFVNDFKQAAAEMGNGECPTPFLEYRDIVIKDDCIPATVWCWWQARGTDLQGTALIKVSEEGILNEAIAYFSPLP